MNGAYFPCLSFSYLSGSLCLGLHESMVGGARESEGSGRLAGLCFSFWVGLIELQSWVLVRAVSGGKTGREGQSVLVRLTGDPLSYSPQGGQISWQN